MKIVMNAAGGAAAGGGSASPSPDSGQNPANPPPKTVSYEDHKRALDDMHGFKSQVKTLQEKIDAIESKKLEEGNQYKTLWETEKKKREDAEAETNKTIGYMKNSVRHGEVKAAAVASGLRKEALADLDLLDMNDVPVEVTSTGRFIVNGAQEKVDRIKADKPHWFTLANPPGINPGGAGAPPAGAGAGGAGGKVTVAQVAQAEMDWKRGKIQKADYEKIYRQYCKDNQKPGMIAQADN